MHIHTPSNSLILILATLLHLTTTTTTASALPKLEKSVLVENDGRLNAFYSILDSANTDSLPEIRDYESTPWPVGQLPVSCVRAAESTGCPIRDVRAYTVKYNECPEQSWPVCYCHNELTQISLSKLISTFGKVPDLARPYVRTMMGMPPKLTYTAYHLGGDLIAVSDIKFRTMMHELAHSLDRGKEDYEGKPPGAEPRLRWKSESEEWRGALGKDTCVLTRYALTNVRESFAVVSVLVLLEIVDSGLADRLKKEFGGLECMRHQLEYVRRELRGFLVPTKGICPNKVNPEGPKMWVDGRRGRRGFGYSRSLVPVSEEEEDYHHH
ncbi:hypothetical protein DFH27DRAFT_282306 [Peziza echinospora]|nr:hypothetical protein DFH27DRAFT_282306 [Peziza echinospora]